jgi:hypothetical protein
MIFLWQELKKKFTETRSRLNGLLFENQTPELLGLMRIFLCGTLFYLACFRHLNIGQYTAESMIPRDFAMGLFPEFYRPFVAFFVWPDHWAAVVHLGLIGLYLLNTLGFSNRLLMFATWAIAQGFIQRNYSILFGADLIGNLLLFYLSFTRSSDYFSLKNKLFKAKPMVKLDLLSSVFYRLIQFQVCIIYAYTGFEKLKGLTWWDGTALWTVLANPQFTNYDLIFLRHFPLFFAVGTFLTIIFEVYFPVMVALRKTRPYWLGAGVIFHLGIGMILSLMPFSLVMCSPYFLFLSADTRNWLVNRWSSLFEKWAI